MPVVRIAFDRPDIRTPGRADLRSIAPSITRQTSSVAAVILTGQRAVRRDGGYSFCSGGDRRSSGARRLFRYEVEDADPEAPP